MVVMLAPGFGWSMRWVRTWSMVQRGEEFGWGGGAVGCNERVEDPAVGLGVDVGETVGRWGRGG